MKNKLIKWLCMVTILIVAGSALNEKPCRAASADVVLSTDAASVTVGDNIFVYLTVTSDTVFGAFEANLTYDDNLMEYTGTNSVVTGGNGFLKLSDMEADGVKKRKYSLKFKALNVGVCQIDFSGNTMLYDDEIGDAMAVSKNVLNININPAQTASNNANLKSLKISPSALTPSFDKNTLKYTAKVGNDTEKLVIDAVAEDSKSTVKISGNESLKEGENKINVTVIAESGAVIEYTIDVTKEVTPTEVTPTIEPTVTPGADHGVFDLVNLDGDVYAIYSGKFQIVTPGSDVKIPEGYVKTQVTLSSIQIDAYVLAKDMENEFILIYAKNEYGDEGFYKYDRIEKTLQRFVTEDAVSIGNNPVTTPNSDSIKLAKYRSNMNKAFIVIALLGALCAALIILLIRLYMKTRGYHDDDLD